MMIIDDGHHAIIHTNHKSIQIHIISIRNPYCSTSPYKNMTNPYESPASPLQIPKIFLNTYRTYTNPSQINANPYKSNTNPNLYNVNVNVIYNANVFCVNVTCNGRLHPSCFRMVQMVQLVPSMQAAALVSGSSPQLSSMLLQAACRSCSSLQKALHALQDCSSSNHLHSGSTCSWSN